MLNPFAAIGAALALIIIILIMIPIISWIFSPIVWLFSLPVRFNSAIELYIGRPLGVAPVWWLCIVSLACLIWKVKSDSRREKVRVEKMSPEERKVYYENIHRLEKEAELERVRKRAERDRYWRDERKRREQEIHKIYFMQINIHSSELRRKRQKYVVNKGYGKFDRSAWDNEMRYFIKTILQHPSRRFCSEEELMKFIDNVLDDSDRAVFSGRKIETGEDFELHCAAILRNSGWEADTTKAGGDQGADILAKKGGLFVAIQCKYYSQPVGNSAVQEIAAARIYYGSKYAAVVSNADYTKSARELAKSNRVFLLNVADLPSLSALIVNGATF